LQEKEEEGGGSAKEYGARWWKFIFIAAAGVCDSVQNALDILCMYLGSSYIYILNEAHRVRSPAGCIQKWRALYVCDYGAGRGHGS
jgi:hypothetical protein